MHRLKLYAAVVVFFSALTLCEIACLVYGTFFYQAMLHQVSGMLFFLSALLYLSGRER